MALRSEYALGHSPYNAFLFAAVGEEKVGAPLTVLSALTRLGLDPWEVAARLSDLPRETAIRSLAAMIATLPQGDWQASDSAAIAARLVRFLPKRSVQPVPRAQVGRAGGANANWAYATALIWALAGVALFFLAVRFFAFFR